MRRHRIEYDGAIYHVIQRSSNKEKIFGQDQEKKKLLGIIDQLKEKMLYKIFGYVIMDNHYHLLLQTGTIPLNKVMHRINFRYSKFYNNCHERHGHVFGGRYKAGLIQDESYLFAVLRYVHQNPVRVGVCTKVSDYSSNSDRAYRTNKNDLVDIELILNTLSSNRKNAIGSYIKLMGEYDELDYGKEKLIGDEEFVQSKKTEVMAENSNLGQVRATLSELLQKCGATEEEKAQIRSGSRKRSLQEYKKRFASVALENGYTFKEIGAFMSINDAAVNKLISK